MSEPLEQVLSAAEWCASNYCTGAEEASLMAAIEHVRAGGEGMTNLPLESLLAGVFAAQGLKHPDVAARKIAEDFERKAVEMAKRDEEIYLLSATMTALAISQRAGMPTLRRVEQIISEQHALRRVVA